MNKMLLGISLMCVCAPQIVLAQEMTEQTVTVGPMKSATVTPFITGLGDPQGLAFNDYKEGSLAVSDFAKGEIVDYDIDGKRRYNMDSANGLQGPTQLVYLPGGFYVAESKTGRILERRIGMLSQIGDAINDPVGIVSSGKIDSTPYVVSQSGKVSHFVPIDNGVKERALAREFNWKTIYEPAKPNASDGIAPAIALDGDSILLTDPAAGEVKLVTSNGRASTLAQGLGKPTFVTTGDGGAFYVGDESNGGQIWRVEGNGEKSVVATGVGRPRAMVWGKPGIAYVADRNGNVWKLSWEK